MQENILVTGGAGFIGSNLVSFLLEKDYAIRVIDDFSVGKKTNLPRKKKNLEIFPFDVRNRKEVSKAMEGCDIVFHLATQCLRESLHNPFLVHDVNTSGTLSVLEASRLHNVKKFVYVSSSEVYGTARKVPMDEMHVCTPRTIYGASKLAGEHYSIAYLKSHQLPVVIVRPFNTYGYNGHFEGQYGEVIPRFILRALNGLPPQIFGSGRQTRDFTFVTDTVRGIVAACKYGSVGQAYNIAFGEETSILQIAKHVLRILQKRLPVEFLPPRPGDVFRHKAGVKKAKESLRFEARVGIEEGLRLYIAWFVKHVKDPKVALRRYKTRNW